MGRHSSSEQDVRCKRGSAAPFRHSIRFSAAAAHIAELVMAQQQQQQRRPPARVRLVPPLASLSAAGSQVWQQKSATPLAVNFSGTWIKDKAASDSMAVAMRLMGLSAVMRQAVKLIKGMTITQDDTSFATAIFSVISWFKITERYHLDGSASSCRRRDFRRGGHRGALRVLAPDRLALALEWGEPYGGVGEDVYSLRDANTLVIDSYIRVGPDKTEARYRSVFRRKGS